MIKYLVCLAFFGLFSLNVYASGQPSLYESVVETAAGLVRSTVKPEAFPDLTLAELIRMVGDRNEVPAGGIHDTIQSDEYHGDYYIPCAFVSDQIKADGNAFKMIEVASLSDFLNRREFEENRGRVFEKSLATQRLPVQCGDGSESVKLIHKTCLHYSLVIKGTSEAQLDQKIQFLLFRNNVAAPDKIVGFGNIKSFLPYLK